MKKLIRDVDEKKGIVQITTYDERWYAQDDERPNYGHPEHQIRSFSNVDCGIVPERNRLL
jgi:hypothetical protein